MPERLFIYVFILFLGTSCFCQPVLLFKKNNRRIAYYEPGDVISVRVKGDKAKFTGQITGFEDSLISFKYYKINPDQITDIYLTTKQKYGTY